MCGHANSSLNHGAACAVTRLERTILQLTARATTIHAEPVEKTTERLTAPFRRQMVGTASTARRRDMVRGTAHARRSGRNMQASPETDQSMSIDITQRLIPGHGKRILILTAPSWNRAQWNHTNENSVVNNLRYITNCPPSTSTRADPPRRENNQLAERPSRKARAAAGAGRKHQTTLDHYTMAEGRPHDNGWGDRARRQPTELQDDIESIHPPSSLT